MLFIDIDAIIHGMVTKNEMCVCVREKKNREIHVEREERESEAK
jgi:hypothetical protein